MPTTLIESVEPLVDTSVGPRRKTWTREEVAALANSGELNVERLELVEGELIDRMGKNRPHIKVQQRIMKALFAIFGLDRVSQESSVEVALSDRVVNEPIPDLVVTERDIEFFDKAPLPRDVDLVVEVSDTTVRYDLTTKAKLYARAGIIEYWVADLNNRTLIIHRQPEQGRYTSVTAYSAEESVSPLAAPEHSILVGSLFP